MVRRKFSTQFKQQVVQECLETQNMAIVARKHDINYNVVARWVQQFMKNGSVPPTKGKSPVSRMTEQEHQQLAQERTELVSENDQLKKLLGEQALEIAILRDLVKKANPHLRIK